MAKWVAAFILLMFATGSSFPIYFTDQVFRSLDQLDEALANGEISQEYYDDVLAEFVGPVPIESLVRDDVRQQQRVVAENRQFPEWYYRADYRQGLEQDFVNTRYDRLALAGRKCFVTASLEKRSNRSYLLRDIEFSVRRPYWKLEIGNINPSYASGLTVGRSGLHRELHSADDFGSSVLFPTQNRKNGVAFSREFRSSNLSAFASRVEGDRYFDQSLGSDFALNIGRVKLGLVMLRQQIGEFGAKSRIINYLAPHFQLGERFRVLTSESSFQLGGAAAHLVQFQMKSRQLTQSYTAFCYGSKYQNLESGGYAYSDYDDATIDEVGMEYRDKRAGRGGIAIEQAFRFHPESLTAQLVRWQNRLDDRQCVAGRLTFEQSNRFRILTKLRFQAIYQDLDIEHATDTRQLITLSTELQPLRSFVYENQHKIEQRVLNSNKKYPFRSRHDFALKINPQLESIAMINFYDSDLNTSGNSQLTLAIGEELQSDRDFRFSTRLQTRYKFSTGQLDNWELRLNLEVIL
ncbi:MAG: hypothetical protein WBP29_07210 [Candidatus Zixiibacteriota bacterium]